MASVSDYAFWGCMNLDTVLVSDAKFKCTCNSCLKCKKEFKNCLQKGREFQRTQEYLKVEALSRI